VSHFTKILPVGAEFSMQTNGRTGRHGKSISRLSQFCERF